MSPALSLGLQYKIANPLKQVVRSVCLHYRDRRLVDPAGSRPSWRDSLGPARSILWLYRRRLRRVRRYPLDHLVAIQQLRVAESTSRRPRNVEHHRSMSFGPGFLLFPKPPRSAIHQGNRAEFGFPITRFRNLHRDDFVLPVSPCCL